MNIQVERLPDCKAKVQIEVPKDTVESERTAVIASYASQANVPGFRKGKVPAKVIETRFGKQIESELLDKLVQAGCRQAIDGEKLSILSVDDISDDEYTDDGAFKFTAEMSTTPEFELPEYKGINVRLPKLEIGEEQIDQSLDRLRQQYASFDDADEGHKLEMGDFAVVSYEGTLDGKPLSEVSENAGGQVEKAAGQWIKMDEEGFLPGFCNGLIDAVSGETRDVTVALPEDFGIEELQGKEVVYKVEVSGIKQQELPELNDELAGKIKEGSTLEELRVEIKEDLERQWTEQLENQKVNQVVEHLDKSIDFDLPATMVANETQAQADGMAQQAQQNGMPEDAILAQQEDILVEAGRRARVQVKTSFMLDQIAEKEEITATDQELTNAILNMASQKGENPKKFVKQLQSDGSIPRIRNSIVTQKALALVVEGVEIEEYDPKDEPEETAEA